jgi:hypothetical protein
MCKSSPSLLAWGRSCPCNVALSHSDHRTIEKLKERMIPQALVHIQYESCVYRSLKPLKVTNSYLHLQEAVGLTILVTEKSNIINRQRDEYIRENRQLQNLETIIPKWHTKPISTQLTTVFAPTNLEQITLHSSTAW